MWSFEAVAPNGSDVNSQFLMSFLTLYEEHLDVKEVTPAVLDANSTHIPIFPSWTHKFVHLPAAQTPFSFVTIASPTFERSRVFKVKETFLDMCLQNGTE